MCRCANLTFPPFKYDIVLQQLKKSGNLSLVCLFSAKLLCVVELRGKYGGKVCQVRLVPGTRANQLSSAVVSVITNEKALPTKWIAETFVVLRRRVLVLSSSRVLRLSAAKQ